jgi:hypothetical protein
MPVDEVRAWLQLGLATLGGSIALLAFFQNMKQRRVENALKFVSLFRGELRQGDLDEWQKLLSLASEPNGCPPGHFANGDECIPITHYFSEGSLDNKAISRMAHGLDVICHQIMSGSADARTVFYELGQLLQMMYYWLEPLPAPIGKESFLQYACPSIHAFFKRYYRQSYKWPCRVYGYIE